MDDEMPIVPPGDGCTWVDLVRLQEHAMYEHGYSRCDLRTNTRRPRSRSGDHYIWPHRAGIALRGGAGLGLRLAENHPLPGSLPDVGEAFRDQWCSSFAFTITFGKAVAANSTSLLGTRLATLVVTDRTPA